MAVLNAGTKFPPNIEKEIFTKVKGHSSLARLCDSIPVPFSGTSEFVFNLDGEAAIVGESGAKPAGSATATPVTITPVKLMYQARFSDEFMHCSEEKQLEYLKVFADGFSKKIGRGFDIAAFHGVDPKTGVAVTSLADKCFDGVIKSANVITFDSAVPDDNIDDAVAKVQDADGDITGIVMAPSFGAALGKMKNDLGVSVYPEYRFGANPGNFAGTASDINSTVSFGNSKDKAVVGDFANAFKWGYAEGITFEVIEYGDPDQTGEDLKAHNQVCLRSEAYIGWGILDADAFAAVNAE